jgi:hypothetical protein
MAERNQEELPRDLVFDILSNARRRYMLYYLRTRDEPVHIQELSAQVAAWENETPVEEITNQERKRVYVSFYQTHIPKLEEAGIVGYNQDAGTVQLTDRAGEIDGYIGGEEETDTLQWQFVYLALAIVRALLFLAASADVLGPVPDLAVGVAIAIAFGLVATAHYLYRRGSEPTPIEEFGGPEE